MPISTDDLRRLLLSPPPREIAAVLKEWRAHHGFSQVDAAVHLGIPVSTLQGWEAGRTMPYTLWAKLGEAPLARALEPLARLAAATETSLPGDDLAAIATAYCEEGWRVDWSLMETIAAAGTREDIIARAAGALYRPWVDALARRFRAAVEVAGDAARPNPLENEPGTLVLFVDGLRMDVGHGLVELLNSAGAVASLTWRLSPVPSLTPRQSHWSRPWETALAEKVK